MNARITAVIAGTWLGMWISMGQSPAPLPGTTPLVVSGDISMQMVAGIDKFLLRETDQAVARRGNLWKRDFNSPENYEKSIATNRQHLRKLIGAVDTRRPVTELEFVASTRRMAKLGESEGFTARLVRWPVFEGVFGEGLLLEPKTPPVAAVIALPDADQTPEQIAGLAADLAPGTQFARRLADAGCLVLVPTLVNRADTWSGSAKLKRFTNQPHREWIYRQAFEVGRHVIGYEVQKVLAAVDWLATNSSSRIGVAGYAEGGLLALHAAALDPRIDAALVSGYFDNRDGLWQEPIYRNVFGLLREFGDAEIASLIAPRALVLEHSDAPKIAGPPARRDGRGGAAPGRWQTPEFNTFDYEAMRAKELAGPYKDFLRVVHGNEGTTVGPMGERSLSVFLEKLGVTNKLPALAAAPILLGAAPDADARQQRAVSQLVDYTQRILRDSERQRDQTFWKTIKSKSADAWSEEVRVRKTNFWEDVMGSFPAATLPMNARSRQIYDKEKWTGYDVMLDVWPDVFAWGVLLLPKDLKPGERRPVVVCQHGLEGVPADTITDDPKSQAYGFYKAYAARLAERGFIVFAPHNPYRGQDAFRTLQRKANPLGRSLFSVILAQHERILDWLGEQPFVDPTRIGFYDLSYGGKTAMRVPALLDRYCLSICSADFNEWVTKNATVDSPYSYMFTGEYEIFEWDLAHTYNYAEMATLIAPRPFMVERGHDDGVAPDEWVAHEFARVRRFYNKLGIGDRAEIEFFNGPHTINGQGTFKFLHKHLQWPEPK
jgi:dienelactone hydrolase